MSLRDRLLDLAECFEAMAGVGCDAHRATALRDHAVIARLAAKKLPASLPADPGPEVALSEVAALRRLADWSSSAFIAADTHDKNQPAFKPFDDVPGLISQIDNIVSGIVKQRDSARAEADRLRGEMHDWRDRAGVYERMHVEVCNDLELVASERDEARAKLAECERERERAETRRLHNSASSQHVAWLGWAEFTDRDWRMIAHLVTRESISFGLLDGEPEMLRDLADRLSKLIEARR